MHNNRPESKCKRHDWVNICSAAKHQGLMCEQLWDADSGVQSLYVWNGTLADGDRTNNLSETWNKAFSVLVGHSQPSALVTVKAFQADLALSEQLIELDAGGQTPVKRVKRSTQQLQRRLRSLCEDRGDGRKSICHLFLTSSGVTERVSTFQLLGIHLDTNLSWSAHINNITSKASKPLYFLKQLKRAGVPYKQLLNFYTAVIRPVEYAAPAWQHLINRTQAQHLESVQKRAIYIIFNFTRRMSYPTVLFVAQLESLETRRNNLSRSFFQDICKPTSCLHHLIPPPRDTSVTTRLRLTTSLPRPNLRMKKYCSFINFGLHHYQPTQWLLTHSTHLSQHLCTYMHILCFVCCFYLLFQVSWHSHC